MNVREATFEFNRFLQRPSNLALAFFCLSSVLLGVSFAGAWGLIEGLSFRPARDRILFPIAFAASTALLAGGSLLLHHASRLVRFESQLDFLSILLTKITPKRAPKRNQKRRKTQKI